MKNLRIVVSSTLLLCILFLIGCGDDPDPKVLKNTNLLAGKKGESKSWIMTSFVIREGSSSEDIFVGVDACLADNIFTFSNSDNQEFEQTEGSAKCDGADPSLIESGSWYLTSNGLTVTVIVFGNDVNNGDAALFVYFPVAWSVTELSGSALVIEYVDDDDIVYTITFEEV